MQPIAHPHEITQQVSSQLKLLFVCKKTNRILR